ncbi:MAG: Gfo/Idh/MocA family oxidoreductase [Verrucomicrobiales bacterium]|jgi:predicted dehydrogenase|nr:Gfo/Idh/MocA family oxidoreductase [Verrucomicrobiales bacterium]
MSIEPHSVGVGVLGATGYIGEPYRAEMRQCDGVRIIAVCARRKEPLQRAALEDGADLATDDWRQVIEHPDVNYVVVGTPDALHYEAVMAAAAAGKHLFCEKPLAMNVGEAREMLQAYLDNETLAHFVPLWTRWSPGFVAAKELIEEGAIGEVKAVIYRWHNPRPADMALTWRDDPTLSSSGTIADVGSHAYDTVRWIIGKDAIRVLAHADTITPAKLDFGNVNLTEALECGGQGTDGVSSRKGNTVDYASIAWEFEGGVVGSIVLSHAPFLRRGLVPELELHGTEASLTVDRFHGKVTIGRPDNSVEVVKEVDPGGFDIGNRFEKWVIPALREVMGGKSQLEVDAPNLVDGLKAQLFTDASLKSSKTGEWVDVGAVN